MSGIILGIILTFSQKQLKFCLNKWRHMLGSSHSASSAYQWLTEMRSVITFDLHSAYISQILEPHRQLKSWLNNWRHKYASCIILFESKYVSKKESTNTFYVDILFEIWVRGYKFNFTLQYFFQIFDTYFDLSDILKKSQNLVQDLKMLRKLVRLLNLAEQFFFLQVCIESSKPIGAKHSIAFYITNQPIVSTMVVISIFCSKLVRHLCLLHCK